MTTSLEAPPDHEVLLTVRAHEFATGWLNAFLASSDEEDRPALYRTICLEIFPEGVQLIATNGVVLFRSWVKTSDKPGPCAWPDFDEAPRETVVVMDTERFAVGFMKTLHKVTSQEEREFESLTLTTVPGDEGATLALGTEFMSERLVLRSCGQRLDLRLYEGAFPAWRGLQLGIEAIERVDDILIQPKILGLVGKLKAVDEVELEFHGKERYIGFRAGVAASLPSVRGMLMPRRKPPKAEGGDND